ncbi:MAG: hypothetical protein AB1896_18575, partial [Thermodesulfobacteriota bacterium]
GLGVAGHFWNDRLEEMAWSAAREDLVRQETALWIILGSAEAFGGAETRYGLSLLAAGVHTQKGYGFPILLAVTQGEVAPETLPTQLAGADVLPADPAKLGPKIAAKANMPVKKIETEYRLDVFGVQGLGQWFEVGPAKGHAWKGVMFGVAGGGEIIAQGVGPRQKLPERSVLEYPMKGLKLQLGETEYTAWAVQNQLDDQTSYYLKVNEYPASILFGPMTETEDAEVYIVKLK